MTPDPDPRTAPDDEVEDAVEGEQPANRGVSAEEPAEGADDAPAGGGGSPTG